ncbi:hypothetical protein [Mastigocladopsis repens]|uniref:hypothetical protein n=1 Tax=Mastigocladopsis repens TaxID=221287 RepID=UPI0002E50D84|nr:hypothetical protein [Mastigocladopsis repens]
MHPQRLASDQKRDSRLRTSLGSGGKRVLTPKNLLTGFGSLEKWAMRERECVSSGLSPAGSDAPLGTAPLAMGYAPPLAMGYAPPLAMGYAPPLAMGYAPPLAIASSSLLL